MRTSCARDPFGWGVCWVKVHEELLHEGEREELRELTREGVA